MQPLLSFFCFIRAYSAALLLLLLLLLLQGQGVSDLAITASKKALEMAGVEGSDIDLVRGGHGVAVINTKYIYCVFCDVVQVGSIHLSLFMCVRCSTSRESGRQSGVKT